MEKIVLGIFASALGIFGLFGLQSADPRTPAELSRDHSLDLEQAMVRTEEDQEKYNAKVTRFKDMERMAPMMHAALSHKIAKVCDNVLNFPVHTSYTKGLEGGLLHVCEDQYESKSYLFASNIDKVIAVNNKYRELQEHAKKS